MINCACFEGKHNAECRGLDDVGQCMGLARGASAIWVYNLEGYFHDETDP